MTTRLGEILVQDGAITPVQLEEALKQQVIFGGRLGTNLIEMGAIGEEEIARVLSRKLGLPFVDPERIMNVPAEVIDLIPRELAEQYRVLPLSLESRRLTLVMAEPSDLQATDEIAFRTGFVIRPVLTPEIRLTAALEKYYGIARQLRYVPTSPAPTRPKRAPARKPAPAKPDAERAMTRTLQSLVSARGRDDIADHLIAHLGREFPVAALFLVRNKGADGWKGTTEGDPLTDFDQLQVPFGEPSLLRSVVEGKVSYFGPVPPSPANERMLRHLGASPDEPALLVPLLLTERIFAILFIGGKGARLPERLFEVQKLAAKAAMSFEILFLKSKVLMT